MATNDIMQRSYSQQLDAQDPLAHFRERFVIDDPEMIYLDGNSLGRMPKSAKPLMENLMDKQWSNRLIRSWNDGWWELANDLGAKFAKVIGADPDEVIVSDSTSVNFFKLVVGALRAQDGRSNIITDNMNFPSDIYVLQGVMDMLGNKHTLSITPSEDDLYGPVDAIKAELNQDTALLTLTHVVYKSGYKYDLADLTKAAHDVGALTLFDLSHSVGACPINLKEANVDMAIGCSYKFVNGGPGAPAFLYIRKDLQEKLFNPIAGWWGQDKPFDFGLDYKPATGIQRFQTGTLPIASLALIECGVDILIEAGMDKLRKKSIQQSEYLLQLWKTRLEPLGFRLNSPTEAEWRGGHISFGHDDGLAIDLAMINDKKIVPDFRPPDNLRLGISPLYTTFEELYETVERLENIVTNKLYEKYLGATPTVT